MARLDISFKNHAFHKRSIHYCCSKFSRSISCFQLANKMYQGRKNLRCLIFVATVSIAKRSHSKCRKMPTTHAIHEVVPCKKNPCGNMNSITSKSVNDNAANSCTPDLCKNKVLQELKYKQTRDWLIGLLVLDMRRVSKVVRHIPCWIVHLKKQSRENVRAAISRRNVP